MYKLLIIEDEKYSREDLSNFLLSQNYTVITAENGEDGIKKIVKHIPDLILCDIFMPIIDGFGVYDFISKHEEYFTIPFIFLTAKSDKDDIRNAMLLGIDDYLVKPVDINILTETIRIRLNKKNRISDKINFEIEKNKAMIDYLKEQLKVKNIKLENIKCLLKNVATTDIGLLRFINEIIIQNKEKIEKEILSGNDWLESFKVLPEPLLTVISDVTTVINLFISLGLIDQQDLVIDNIKNTSFYEVLTNIKLRGGLNDDDFDKVLKYCDFSSQERNIIEF